MRPRTQRTSAGALSALAAAIGTMLFPAAPAKADPLALFFAPAFPIPFPVFVHHEWVYEQPRVLYEPRVVYERPDDQPSDGYSHRRGFRPHGDARWHRGGGAWGDDDHPQDERYDERRDVGDRGRY
jgi:hypothetical protein